jgi:hypothetical protein
MLYNLKKEISRQNFEDIVMETTVASASDDKVKSLFLDDFETVLLGAETDPEVKDIAEHIPEYDGDTDLETEQSIMEGLINVLETIK